MAKYDKDNKPGDKLLNPQQETTYAGFNPGQFQKLEKEATPPPSQPIARAEAQPQEVYINDTEREQAELERLTTATVMPTAEFIDMAELSLKYAGQVVNRIEVVEELLAEEPVVLDEKNADLLEKLIGKRVIDKDAAKCLLQLANYSDLEPAYDAYLDGDPIENADRPLREVFSDERVNEAFPDFGFMFIILIIFMAYEFIVTSIHCKLCSFFKKILFIFGLGQLICMSIFVPAAKALLVIVGKSDTNVSDKNDCELSLEMVIDRWIAGRNLMDPRHGTLTPDQLPDTPPSSRCSEDYAPTFQERAMAQHLVEAGTRIEQQAQKDKVMSDIELNKKEKSRFMLTNMSLLESMKADSHQFIFSSKAIVHKIHPLPGYFATDKVEASVIGFFVNLNGLMQKVDAGVTKVLALEMLDEEAKQWLCCIVRFLYLIIPRITAIKFTNDADNRNAKIATEILSQRRGEIASRLDNGEPLSMIIYQISNEQDDPEVTQYIRQYGVSENYKDLLVFESYVREGFSATLSLDDQKVIDQAKVWIALIDAVITLLLGNVSINFDLNFNISTAILDIVKQSIAEAGSAIMSIIYMRIKEKMFGLVTKLETELPDIALALDTCEPIKWFLQNLECSIEGFFAKLQELLAQIWSDAQGSLDAMDTTLSITANNKSFTLFKNLLTMLLEWDQALINFCSLKKTATEAERRAIIDRTLGTMTSSIFGVVKPKFDPIASVSRSEKYVALLSEAGSVFSPNVNLTPDGSDPYESQLNGNPFTPNIKMLHMQMFGEYKPEDFQVEPGKPHLSPTQEDSPARAFKEAVMSCGDQFKALLRGRLNDIEEIHRAVADGE